MTGSPGRRSSLPSTGGFWTSSSWCSGSSFTLRGRTPLTSDGRHPSAAIAWVLGLLLVPYLALPLYLTFGSRKVVLPLPAE